MLRIHTPPTLTEPRKTRTAAPRALRCRAQSDTLAEKALTSPDDHMRHWALNELVRRRPTDGGQDAMRCSHLAAFVRSHGASDQHALLDAVDRHGLTPRMLPVYKELMQSRFAAVRYRAAPVWSTLIGLYRITGRDGNASTTGSGYQEREPRA